MPTDKIAEYLRNLHGLPSWSPDDAANDIARILEAAHASPQREGNEKGDPPLASSDPTLQGLSEGGSTQAAALSAYAATPLQNDSTTAASPQREGDVFLRRIGMEAAKSACVFCPYRSAASWRTVRDVPEDWKAAVAYDEAIRDARPGFKSYVHRNCAPLAEAVLEHDDPGLFDDECDGVCAA